MVAWISKGTQELEHPQITGEYVGEEEEYDHLDLHSSYTPSLTSSAFREPFPAAQPDSDSLADHEGVFFFPEDAQIIDDFVVYQESVNYHDPGALQFERHNNQHTFRPVFCTPQVNSLIEASVM